MPVNFFYAEFPERNWELQAAEAARQRLRARREKSEKQSAEAAKMVAKAAAQAFRKRQAEANYGIGAVERGVGGVPY